VPPRDLTTVTRRIRRFAVIPEIPNHLHRTTWKTVFCPASRKGRPSAIYVGFRRRVLQVTFAAIPRLRIRIGLCDTSFLSVRLLPYTTTGALRKSTAAVNLIKVHEHWAKPFHAASASRGDSRAVRPFDTSVEYSYRQNHTGMRSFPRAELNKPPMGRQSKLRSTDLPSQMYGKVGGNDAAFDVFHYRGRLECRR